MSWKVGKILNEGKYTIKETLPGGNGGKTYKAIDNQLNELVVIKVPDNIGKVTSFDREMQSLRSLLLDPDINNVAKLKGSFEEPETEENESIKCLVIEFIDGNSLENRLDQSGHVEEKQAITYICQIGKALITLHEEYGRIHRDIKPANIMIRDSDDQAILIDFGISGWISQNLNGLTIYYGTPPYAAPEQGNGN